MKPRHTLAHLQAVDAEKQQAGIDLGSLHGVNVGDVFELCGISGFGRQFTVTHAEEERSRGTLRHKDAKANLDRVRNGALASWVDPETVEPLPPR